MYGCYFSHPPLIELTLAGEENPTFPPVKEVACTEGYVLLLCEEVRSMTRSVCQAFATVSDFTHGSPPSAAICIHGEALGWACDLHAFGKPNRMCVGTSPVLCTQRWRCADHRLRGQLCSSHGYRALLGVEWCWFGRARHAVVSHRV